MYAVSFQDHVKRYTALSL